MIKILCLAVCMLLAPLAIAKDNYIRVIGQGPTLDKAKDNAFREAIQIKVGSVVLSERESTIKQINKDDISVYSAGYIQDFKLVAVIATDGNVIATIDVLVSESKLVDQRLSSGKSSGEFDGVTANVRYTSFMDQKNRGDKILNSVLASYPQSALIIIQKPHNILIDSYRNAILEIPYELSWNYDYIVSFNEAVSILHDSRYGLFQRAPANVIITVKNPKDFLIGDRYQHMFNDRLMLNSIKYSLGGHNEVRILLSLKDAAGTIVGQTCRIPNFVLGTIPSFYNIGEPNVVIIEGNRKENSIIKVQVSADIIQRTNHIELALTTSSKC